LNGILNTGQNFIKQTKQQKKDFLQRLDETYLMILDRLKNTMPLV
jgi:ClpP class serine protease